MFCGNESFTFNWCVMEYGAVKKEKEYVIIKTKWAST